MKLVGRIPVEPLDEERLTNIERRLVVGVSEMAVPRARAPRRGLAFAGAAFAVAAAGVIGWKLHSAPEVAPVVEHSTLAVHTDADRSTLDIGDALITSDPTTAFAVTRPSGGVLVAMEHGKVELEVAKRHDRPPLVVRAGDTDVEVVGTHFSVAWDGHGEVDVRVTEGTVRVKRQQKMLLVTKGNEWTSGSGVVVAMADVPVATAGDDHQGSDEIQIEPKDDPTVLRGHHGTAPDAAGSAAAQGSGSTAKPIATTAAAKPTHLRIKISKKDPYYDLKSAIEAQPLAPAMEIPGVTAADDLMKEYSRIVINPDMTGEPASKAFYSMALVRHFEGRDDDALRTIDLYLRRFSGGKFSGSEDYKAALWLRVRIQCLAAIDERCHQAAYNFGKQVTEGAKAGIVDKIAATP